MENKKRQTYLALGIIFLILIIDQLLKVWIKTSMMLGEEIRITDWFIIHFTENPGMAFGMEFGGSAGKLILSLFRIIAIGFMAWYLFSSIKKGTNYYFLTALSLILAGALGNLIDSAFYGLIFDHSSFQVAEMFPEGGVDGRFLHGKVVDMFYFPIINGYYPEWLPKIGGEPFTFFKPVFNIADASITTGVFSFIVFYKKAMRGA
ncbi:MAG: lipoprotein signal peptidase [Bacteroidota bacterium]